MAALIAAAAPSSFFDLAPRWAVMWLLALALFFAAKIITLGRIEPATRLNPYYYTLFWVGMDVRPFCDRAEPRLRTDTIATGIGKMLAGALLLWVVAPQLADAPYAAGWLGLVGMVLLIHFGFFHLLAVFWQRQGVPVEPIMRKPLLSRTLAEFWSERWNRAFHMLMHRFVFRPGRKLFGTRGAAFAVFLVSGIVHDLVISIPAQGGYGLPTLYFVFQFVGLVAQKSGAARSLGLNQGAKGWLFTMAFTTLPLPLLFPGPFI